MEGRFNNSLLFDFWRVDGELIEAKCVDESLSPPQKNKNAVQFFLVVVAIGVVLTRKFRRQPLKGLMTKDGLKKKREVPVAKGVSSFMSIPIVDSLYNACRFVKDGVKLIEKLASENGLCFEAQLGLRSAYFTSDPVIIQKILTSNKPAHLSKAKEYREIFLTDFLKDAVFVADHDVWNPHRKILGRSFTHKSLQSYLGIMNRNAKAMGQHMIQPASSTGSIYERPMVEVEFNALKMITEIILGADMMTDEELLNFLHTYKTGKELFLDRIRNPILIINTIWRFHPKRKQMESAIQFMRDFVTSITNKYKEKRRMEREQGIEWVEGFGGSEEGDFGIKPFRSMMEEMIHGGMSDKQIVDEVIGMMLVGHETTSMALNTLMFHLALNPEVQKMCRDEVDEIVGSKVEDTDLTMEDLNNMKFLERCILENLRLTPTVPVYVRRLDEPLRIDDDFEMEGNGKNVVMLAWVVHRNPEYYPNPEKFDPDRFLPENVKDRQAKNYYTYLPFSGGQKICMGWKMSIMEMKTVMFWILRNFEIHTKDRMEDITFHIDISLMPHRDIDLTLKRRTQVLEDVSIPHSCLN